MSEQDDYREELQSQRWYDAINTWVNETRDMTAYNEFVLTANLAYALYLSIKNGYVRIADLTRAGREALYLGYDHLWTSNLIPHEEN